MMLKPLLAYVASLALGIVIGLGESDRSGVLTGIIVGSIAFVAMYVSLLYLIARFEGS